MTFHLCYKKLSESIYKWKQHSQLFSRIEESYWKLLIWFKTETKSESEKTEKKTWQTNNSCIHNRTSCFWTTISDCRSEATGDTETNQQHGPWFLLKYNTEDSSYILLEENLIQALLSQRFRIQDHVINQRNKQRNAGSQWDNICTYVQNFSLAHNKYEILQQNYIPNFARCYRKLHWNSSSTWYDLSQLTSKDNMHTAYF